MTSVFITRRAMLSGGTLMGLGTLLTACGQQASNEASASASSAVAPSETASATAAASESPSASATPSTVRGYSGRSKAPDGEYRPADSKGPAQNMPKPAAPEEGYREKSISGLEKTIRAWANWRNYAVETGDFAEVRQYIAPSLKSEVSFYDEMSGLYQKGGWIIDGHNEFVSGENPQKVDDHTYLWKVYRKWNFVMYVHPDGSWETRENREIDNNSWELSCTYTDDRWLITGLKKINKAS
ncbi:DUF6318 family protein [Rothia mucilaginosa]|uniref:DUF6318 family protein n=1 Tax=Rothia mucilaginosa TaxID=43675 RepID=UPI0034D5DFF0